VEQPLPPQRLTEQRIIEGALELVRTHGARRLSMRTLARDIGVSPMALYNHVSNKEVLLDRLRDAVIARVELPEPSAADWQQQMRDYALRATPELAKYPDLLKPETRRSAQRRSEGLSGAEQVEPLERFLRARGGAAAQRHTSAAQSGLELRIRHRRAARN
jgi:AcrR family transcriptional regulator